MPEPPRAGPRRQADAIAILEVHHADTWVATASESGNAHLVPLSFAWHDGRVLLALQRQSPTSQNIVASGRARLGFGPTRDVVLMDAVVDSAVAVTGAPAALAEAYAAQADWDPRGSNGDYVYLVLVPVRIQAWREANELEGRLLMRNGVWLYP